MIYNDSYTLDVEFNSTSMDLSPSSFSMSIHDSIHSFYSSAQLKLKDTSGSFREYLVPTEGNLFTLSLGDTKTILKSKFVVVNDESESTQTVGVLNFPININMLHSYYNNQERISKAYNDKISSTLTSLLSSESFDKNIMATDGAYVWYRLFFTQEEFIKQVLLPSAYSYSHNTPFYCFIGVDNVFNFVTYDKMLQSSPVATLKYFPYSPQESDIGNILSIEIFKTGSLKTKDLRKRVIYARSLTTGEYSSKEDTIDQYPDKKEKDLYIPIVSKNDKITGFKDVSFAYTREGAKEAYLAQNIYDEKGGFFLERFIVTTALNPKLVSGKTINLETYITEDNKGVTPSLYNSDKFLIEDTIHSWEGFDKKRGTTTIIIGRKFVYASNSQSLRDSMIKAN